MNKGPDYWLSIICNIIWILLGLLCILSAMGMVGVLLTWWLFGIGLALGGILGIIITVMEPVGSPESPVSLDFQDNVRDIVSPCRGVRSICVFRGRIKNRLGFLQRLSDLIASLDLVFHDIQNAVLGEGRNICIHIKEIQGKQISCLKIFDLGAVLPVAACIDVGRRAGYSTDQ